MTMSTRERQRKWCQKQLSSGRQAVTVMLPAEIKNSIDRGRKETGLTIAQIVTTAVANLLSSTEKAATGTKPISDRKWLNTSVKKLDRRAQI